MTTIRGWLMEISIHAPRTGSDRKYHRCRPLVAISIHAPRTGSDWSRSPSPAQRFISIHAPRTGSDASRSAASFASIPFQSTLPARGATRGDGAGGQARRNFNPRSPHGERPACCVYVPLPRDFNPRSPHGERPALLPIPVAAIQFQSTLPARGATRKRSFPLYKSMQISIHAPRTGSDVADEGQNSFTTDFNPRSPHGERLLPPPSSPARAIFQSTLPARGATGEPPPCGGA